jgi:hypothetical protein
MYRLMFVVPLITGLLGCSSDNGLNLGKVRGKITYDGEPVVGGEVLFVPDTKKGTVGPPAAGTISGDGTYLMSTQESGDGAIVGVHNVAIIGHGKDPIKAQKGAIILGDDSPAEDVFKVKQSLGSQKRKNQGPTVRDKGGNTYLLTTPEKMQNPDTSGVSIKVDRGSNVKNIVITKDGQVTVN